MLSAALRCSQGSGATGWPPFQSVLFNRRPDICVELFHLLKVLVSTLFLVSLKGLSIPENASGR